MNILKQFFVLLFVVVAGTGCIKQEQPVFIENIAEFDAASFNATFGANLFPYLIRQNATFGRAVLSTDAFITRTSGSVTLRVNMTGAQRSMPTTVRYQTFAVGNLLGTGTGPTPAGTTTYSSTMINTNIEGVAATHYTGGSGTLTIPANSSFGVITIPIVNSGTSANTTTLVGLELIAGGDLKPSLNYNKVVFGINQR